MTARMLVIMAALVGWLAACGRSDAESEPDGEEGSGGGADGPRDFEVLSACASGACSRESFAQLIEGSSHYIDRESVSCVLTALRDRTPGRYLHETDSTFGNGSAGAYHAVVVLEDGTAFYARQRYSFGPVEPFDREPGQRCVLKPASYFAACLGSLENASNRMNDEAWGCVFGDGEVTSPSALDWFESCEPASPAACP